MKSNFILSLMFGAAVLGSEQGFCSPYELVPYQEKTHKIEKDVHYVDFRTDFAVEENNEVTPDVNTVRDRLQNVNLDTLTEAEILDIVEQNSVFAERLKKEIQSIKDYRAGCDELRTLEDQILKLNDDKRYIENDYFTNVYDKVRENETRLYQMEKLLYEMRNDFDYYHHDARSRYSSIEQKLDDKTRFLDIPPEFYRIGEKICYLDRYIFLDFDTSDMFERIVKAGSADLLFEALALVTDAQKTFGQYIDQNSKADNLFHILCRNVSRNNKVIFKLISRFIIDRFGLQELRIMLESRGANEATPLETLERTIAAKNVEEDLYQLELLQDLKREIETCSSVLELNDRNELIETLDIDNFKISNFFVFSTRYFSNVLRNKN